ncbi:hypothetical protein KSP40_PGU022263 [Platanthera guangdongensis]|uniref:Uncharacterized protein n=1 Tax=Platanthera guangdongensis TaxID=2320717 RepID=A0ABR2MFQ6_9ASPA
MKKGLSKFPLSGWEVVVGLAMLASFGIGLLGVYLSMPPSNYSFLKLPRTLEELQTLRYCHFLFSPNNENVRSGVINFYVFFFQCCMLLKF